MVAKIDSHFTTSSKSYYRKLQERRLYTTHKVMPPNEYARFTVTEGLEEACNLHWEYYCFASLEWNKKFALHGACLDHAKKCIQWKNDDDLEDFYEDDNCMDFDEQSTFVKEMSLHDIDIARDPYIWYTYTLGRNIDPLVT
jgi:hypothetical protein